MRKHLIFDLGNVLLEIHPERAMQGFARQCGFTSQEIQKFYLSELHLGFMEGRYSPDRFFREMMRQFPCDISQTEFHSIWLQVIGEPKPGIAGLITKLKNRHSLSICSNTDPWHWEFALKNFKFLSLFEFYFLSYELKINKPSPAIFLNILKKLDASGEECVFVDDTQENIIAARQSGMTAIWADKPEHIERELRELKLL